ncbi:Gfo/Idh/MocA family protein [Microlunatus soli]|uniref:Predicted dehydrogenase n=1 Tax=Microlunatus soli TaxID=630515 RepID=A0A1H1X557_9ACTN|nr:Gfo/Idh/MocA family oxidoreductase [Microlunatus soli]SDT04428.1 Predicted dehydrogenase [Microlunatus soli]
MRRVGIIGIENSHTDHFIRHLNDEQRFPGTEVTAILRGEDTRVARVTHNRSLTVVDDPTAMIGSVDAAIVCSRDGALHRPQAEPLLAAGIPVLVDKPLATSVQDADALIAAADSSAVPLLSASAVRFTPGVGALLAARDDGGPLTAVSVTGPADPASPWSGLFFYGIHVVETAFELIGAAGVSADLDRLAVHRETETVVVTTSIDGIAATLRFVEPDEHGQVPFSAAVFGRHGSSSRDLPLGPDYNLPLLERFVAVLDGTTAPPARQDLIAPVALTAAIRDQLRTPAAVQS